MFRQSDLSRHRCLLVVIDELDVDRALITPSKANAILLVDSDGVLPLTIAAELLQTIAGRSPQVVQRLGVSENGKLVLRLRVKSPRELPPRLLGVESIVDILAATISKLHDLECSP